MNWTRLKILTWNQILPVLNRYMTECSQHLSRFFLTLRFHFTHNFLVSNFAVSSLHGSELFHHFLEFCTYDKTAKLPHFCLGWYQWLYILTTYKNWQPSDWHQWLYIAHIFQIWSVPVNYEEQSGRLKPFRNSKIFCMKNNMISYTFCKPAKPITLNLTYDVLSI